MRTLLLTSAGMQVKDEILKLLPKPANQIKLAHIITASKAEENTQYVKKDSKAMMELGFQVAEVDIEGKAEKELRELLKDFDIVYVQGGNTFYLLKTIRESGFESVLRELIEQGKIYIGVSAGSIIMGPTIEVATWKGVDDRNKVKMTDFTALRFVSFNIFVHYAEEQEELVRSEVKKSPYSTRILTDDQAFLIQDDKVTFVGKGEEIRIGV